MTPRSAALDQEVNAGRADEVFAEHGRRDLVRLKSSLAGGS